MSNYSFLDISSSFTSLCDLSFIENEIESIRSSNDRKLRNTYKNSSSEKQRLSVVDSFNTKYVNTLIIKLFASKCFNLISFSFSDLDISFEGELDLNWQSVEEYSIPSCTEKKTCRKKPIYVLKQQNKNSTRRLLDDLPTRSSIFSPVL